MGGLWASPDIADTTDIRPGVRHTGGQLGPALAIAQGMVLDAPHRLVVPLIGDGELETGATAAAWLARRALTGSGDHGAVLPVVLANGLKMGGPSLLAGMNQDEVRGYFTGLGYESLIHDGADLPGFRRLLSDALHQVRPLSERGRQPVIVLTMPKGHTGPDRVAGRQIIGTPVVHKTPLKDPRRDDTEFAALAARGETSRFHVVGYREPSRPTTPEGLLDHCGISAAALSAQATLMLKEHTG